MSCRLRAPRTSLVLVVVAVAAIVMVAAAAPSVLVPNSSLAFPGWEAGPLGLLPDHLTRDPTILNAAFSVILLGLFWPYRVLRRQATALSGRALVAAVVAVHLIVLLSPPLPFTDVFNYLGYARLGALHHLSPYSHPIADEAMDPVAVLASWHHLRSPYGELFTMLTYPLGLLPLPVAYWVLKGVVMTLSLGVLWLVGACARCRGIDARRAVVFVAFNPVYLLFELGGFHNDGFMLVPALVALLCVLRSGGSERFWASEGSEGSGGSERSWSSEGSQGSGGSWGSGGSGGLEISLGSGRSDRWAGAGLALAVAAKFTAILLVPFVLVAVRGAVRRRQLAVGAALALAPVVAMSVLLFGWSLPNLGQQSTLLIPTSIPNLVGLVVGVGGDRVVLALADAGLVAVVGVCWWRRRPAEDRGRGRSPRRLGSGADWLTGAGWSTLALLASLSWLVPWYIVWVLPLTALSPSPRLRRATMVMTTFLALTFMPVTGTLMHLLHINLLDTPAGRASQSLQARLAQ